MTGQLTGIIAAVLLAASSAGAQGPERNFNPMASKAKDRDEPGQAVRGKSAAVDDHERQDQCGEQDDQLPSGEHCCSDRGEHSELPGPRGRLHEAQDHQCCDQEQRVR